MSFEPTTTHAASSWVGFLAVVWFARNPAQDPNPERADGIRRARRDRGQAKPVQSKRNRHPRPRTETTVVIGVDREENR